MTVHRVAEIEDIPEGTRKIVQVEGRSIGVYNVKGEYYALSNYCPHQGAELCKGPVCGTTLESNVYEYKYGRDQEIIRCPWHGWEFDIKTGKSLFNERIRTRTYPLKVKDGYLELQLGNKGGEDHE
ncbi:Rieske (2Fe-2S) protein [Paenibacillus beijingensis]|uniref:2Fe-2S ferredoxin n=1 Tax=Paenibacillus beijingensis TaxID=1126833 RepID=A0A0D5NJU9_9BACL|nr:Rieske (2Fe-2S) protein [Paenibacillus beijingensis]AJY75614.1 2Fe-2S ferredoxin [Paenibacillus beijingensis]